MEKERNLLQTFLSECAAGWVPDDLPARDSPPQKTEQATDSYLTALARQYAHRLQELKAAGAQISLVQVYSAYRPAQNADCDHLPLKTLSRIARCVRGTTGLRVEVF
jgi:hypothetical protein